MDRAPPSCAGRAGRGGPELPQTCLARRKSGCRVFRSCPLGSPKEVVGSKEVPHHGSNQDQLEQDPVTDWILTLTGGGWSGLSPVLSLAALACATLLLARTGLGSWARLVAPLIVGCALMLTLGWLMADQFTGNGIDGSIFFHLEMGMTGAAYGEFSWQIALGALALAVVIADPVVLYRAIPSKGEGDRAKLRGMAGLSLGVAVLLANPGSIDLLRMAQGLRAPSEVVPEAFVVIEDLPRIEAPRNFVILYLEQYERSLLEEAHFPGLSPNLRDLAASSLSFTNIRQVTGTSWSIASMTAGFCGVPIVGTAMGNSMSGLEQFLPRATCLGDLLSRQGYRLEHMVGADLDFAGWGNLFEDHGFASVKGVAALREEVPPGTQPSPWGLHDEDVLRLAADRIIALSKTGQPFGFVVNTLDTHHPRGHAGPACDLFPYADGADPLLNAVSCADRLITDWIQTLERSGALDDAVLLVASDHLAMPNTIWSKLEPLDRTNLLFVRGEGINAEEDPRPGSLLDVGATVLDLIGYPVEGLGLGRSLVGEGGGTARVAEIEATIAESAPYIASLWAYPGLGARLEVNREARSITLGSRTIRYPALFRLDPGNEVRSIQFSFHGDMSLSEVVERFAVPERFLWIDDCSAMSAGRIGVPDHSDGACALIGTERSNDLWVAAIPDRTPIETHDILAALDLDDGRIAFLPVSAPVVAEDGHAGGHSIVIRSAAFGAGRSYVENVDLNRRIELQRGVSVLGRSLDGGQVSLLGHADTCAIETTPDALEALEFHIARFLPGLSETHDWLYVVVHDSADCGRHDLSEVFIGTDLKVGRGIGYRTPYIGIIGRDGQLYELTGRQETAIELDTANLIDPRETVKR